MSGDIDGYGGPSRIELDRSATRAVGVRFPGRTWSGIAYSAAGESTIEVMPEVGTPWPNSGQVPPIVVFQANGPVVALGTVRGLPMWIEAGASPSTFRLFYGELDSSNTPITHEITYPFASGAHPTLITTIPSGAALVFDEDAGPAHDLMLAIVVVRHDGTVATTMASAANPGGTRGTIVTTSWWSNEALDEWTQQVVVFFDDPGSFVRFDIQVPFFDRSLDGPYSRYSVSEVARGTWPFKVVSGTEWFESAGIDGPQPVALRNPIPLALLLDNGDVVIWQFTRGVSEGESFIPRFAHVTPGSRVIGTAEVAALNGVWVADAAGAIELFGDGDCYALDSGSIRGQILSAIPVGSMERVGDDGLDWGPGAIDLIDGTNYFTLSPGELGP